MIIRLFTVSYMEPGTHKGMIVALSCGNKVPCNAPIIPSPAPSPTVNAIGHLEIQLIFGMSLVNIISPRIKGINASMIPWEPVNIGLNTRGYRVKLHT